MFFEGSAADSESSGVFTISGEVSNLGIIQNVTSFAMNMFGYVRKTDLVGQNIIQIIPSPIAEGHHVLLERYLKTGYQKVIDRSQTVFGVNREGFIFPFALCVKDTTDISGKRSFMGITKTVKESTTTALMIMDEQLGVIHFSRLFGEVFQVRPHPITANVADRQKGIIPINRLIPSLTQDKASIFTTRGTHVTVQNVHGVRYEIRVSGDPLTIGDYTAYVCRVVFKQAGAAGDHHDNIDPKTGLACPFKEGESDTVDDNTGMNMMFAADSKAAEADEFSTDNLTNVGIPDHIKTDVVAGNNPLPVKFDAISILSVEVVDFAETAVTIGAENAFKLLHSIEAAADDILKYSADLFKVKFNKGHLLVAAGLSHGNAKGTAHLHESTASLLGFAQELQAALGEHQIPGAAEGTFVEIKAGVHTGSVSGGLIGTTFPAYHLLGAAVAQTNLVAASSEPGFIQVTQAAKSALGESAAFSFEERGEVVVDGSKVTVFVLKN